MLKLLAAVAVAAVVLALSLPAIELAVSHFLFLDRF